MPIKTTIYNHDYSLKRWRVLLIILLLVLLFFFLLLKPTASGQFVIHAKAIAVLPDQLNESSGLAITAPNRLWSHNDSGNTNELFCIDTTGNLLKQIKVYNAFNVDWEDLAMDPEKNIYINDAGNNNSDRQDLRIYRIPNPDFVEGDFIEAEVIDFHFEDQVAFPPPPNNQNFDIEGIIWREGMLYLFTKNRSNPLNGYSKMYRLPASPGEHTAMLIDSVYMGNTNDEARVTAADFNKSTGELALLTRTKVVVFTNYVGDRFLDGQKTTFYFSTPQGQVEALVFGGGRTLYMTEEKTKSKSGSLYTFELPLINDIIEKDKIDITLYPNPTSDFLTLSTYTKPDKIELFDSEGTFVTNFNRHSTQLNLKEIAAGTYIMRLNFGTKTICKHIIKL
jgi:hypothetical protein